MQGEACDRPRREEREKERERRGSPNEYLISAYLTPGQSLKYGEAAAYPKGAKGSSLIPCDTG